MACNLLGNCFVGLAVSYFECLFIEWTGVENEKKKLFAKSFIYCRQIDSLSNQSARTTRELPLLVYFLASFRLYLLLLFLFPLRFSLRSCLVLLFSFFASCWNKQLLSTFRPAKWEKATAVQLSRVWRVFQGFPPRQCKGRGRRAAISSLPWRSGDADENKTWRVQQTSLLMLRLANCTNDGTVLISRQALFHSGRRHDVSNKNFIEP